MRLLVLTWKSNTGKEPCLNEVLVLTWKVNIEC